MRQGDPLSPTLCSIFIDVLVQLLEVASHGVDSGDEKLQLMLYVADIMVLDRSFDGIQVKTDILSDWCLLWG